MDQSLKSLLKLVADGGASPNLAADLHAVERAAADFVSEAKTLEASLPGLDAPPGSEAALQREIAELEHELRDKNALIANIETRMAEWREALGRQNVEAKALLDGTMATS